MKRVLQYLLVFVILFSQACEGPEGDPGPAGPAGPQGPAGAQGPPGTSATATVFEIQDDLTAENEYATGVNFAEENITVGETDIVLVYLLYTVQNNQPFWSPLPQSFFPAEGAVTYNFTYGQAGVIIFMEAENAANQTEAYTTDQVFRIVIIPGNPLNGRVAKPNIDYKNYNEVAKYYNITDSNVKKIKLD